MTNSIPLPPLPACCATPAPVPVASPAEPDDGAANFALQLQPLLSDPAARPADVNSALGAAGESSLPLNAAVGVDARCLAAGIEATSASETPTMTRDQAEALVAMLTTMAGVLADVPPGSLVIGGSDERCAASAGLGVAGSSADGALSRPPTPEARLVDFMIMAHQPAAAASAPSPEGNPGQEVPAVPAVPENVSEVAPVAVQLAGGRELRTAGRIADAAHGVEETEPAAELSSPLGSEKIAAPAATAELASGTGRESEQKKPLSAYGEPDGNRRSAAGIGHAKDGFAMTQPALVIPTKVEPFIDGHAFGLRLEPAPQVEGTLHELHPTLAAHRAVEAVSRVLDLRAAAHTRSAPTVEVRLTLGGEDLAIKVDLRDGVVQTQFRTSSAELCTAIAQQWNAVRAEAHDRPFQFLEPEYVTTQPETGQDRQSGFAHQGDTSRRQGSGASEVFGSVQRSYRYGAEGTPAPEASALPSSTSQHLSAVA